MVYKSEDLSLVCSNSNDIIDLYDNKLNSFNSISAASSFLKINPSTIKTLLNTKIANSKGYYFFDHPISDDLKKELLLNPNVRDSVSKLRIQTWVYNFNLNLFILNSFLFLLINFIIFIFKFIDILNNNNKKVK